MHAFRFQLAILSVTVIAFSCKEVKEVSNPLINSPQYQQEELNVYKQLTDELLDSVGFPVPENAKLVFYMADTLAAQRDWEGSKDLIADDLQSNSFAIAELANSKHKFIRSTDTLRLEAGDTFTSRWINLTRVRFNKDFTTGFLSVGVYCGNLCSWQGAFDIQKKDGKWKIVKKHDGPPA
jgi:hypothetical protein